MGGPELSYQRGPPEAGQSNIQSESSIGRIVEFRWDVLAYAFDQLFSWYFLTLPNTSKLGSVLLKGTETKVHPGSVKLEWCGESCLGFIGIPSRVVSYSVMKAFENL